MNQLRSALAVLATAAALAGVAIVAQPSPPAARANVGCSVVSGVIGAVGGGNPVGDACDAVTDGAIEAVTAPVTSELNGIAKGILGQVTTWVSEGATWLISEVVAEIDKTTTPKLTTEGFLSEYARMAQVASILAAAMFLMALLEAVVQGSWAVLGKAVFVSVPLAFVGTSIAFVLVQLMLVVTDGMSNAVSVATQEHSQHFFKAAIGDLSRAGATAGRAPTTPGGGAAGEAVGAVGLPLFVIFLTAIVGAFAALCVWIELLFRDAAVYVVVLFMPLAAAAAISPRWAHVLRRYIEVIVTVIGSKFVIVSVVALAASLISEEGAGVEHIFAASALLLVACFCPFLLFRMVLSTEAAVSAAFSRRSAAGGASGVVQMAGGPEVFAHMARSNWKGPEVWSVKGDEGGGDQGGGARGGTGTERPPGFATGSRGPGETGSAAEGAAGGAEAGVTPVGPVVTAAKAAAEGAQSAAHHLEQTATARIAQEPAPTSPAPPPSDAGDEGAGEKDLACEEVPEPPREEGPRRSPAEPPPRPPDQDEALDGGGPDE